LLQFAQGVVHCLILLVISSVLMIVLQYAAKRGRVPKIRRLPAIDAIDEAIGRATEMGRPVHYTPGLGGFHGYEAPMTIAGISVLSHAAKKAAEYNTPIIVTFSAPSIEPVVADVVKQAYLEAGKPEAFSPDNIRFISTRQFAYAAGVVGTLHREKVAANLMIGYFSGESMIIAEAGFLAGAIQIGATANTYQIPFFVVACDHVLVSEELYAAGAYLSKDPVQLGAIAGQDLLRLIVVALIAAGSLLATLGISWIDEFFKI
jgi:hypothetical protein